MGETESANGFSWQAVCSPSGEVMMRENAGEVFLVPIRGRLAEMKKRCSVNPVAAFIWKHLDGQTTLEQIREGLLERFDVEREEAERDVFGFVRELLGAGLVEFKQ
jgi:hypothetical protein